MQASNGKLYGMTSSGGSNNSGVLFEFDPATGTYTKKLDFDGSNGSRPYYTHLIQICPPKLTNIQESICDGDSIFLEDAWQTEAGTYYDTLSTVCGSDSIIETQLTVNETFLFTQGEEICNGDTLTWRGSEYDSAGTYYDSLLTVNGCDSVYQLNLTVHPTYLFQDTTEICDGQTYNWRGEDYTESGTFYDSLITVNSCDSVYVLELTVNSTYLFTEQTEICQGESFNWRGAEYSSAGTFYDSLLTVNGCDSIYQLELSVNQTYEFTEQAEICDGETYTWRSDDYTESGTYYDSLLTINGCDSVYTLELTVNPAYLFTEQAEICQEESYNWRGADYSSAGTFYDSLLTVNGCDSVYQLELTVNQTYEFTEQAEICDGETYTWRSDDYTESGIYYDSLLTTSGCDSVYKLDLNVFNLPVVNLGDDQTITTQDSLTLDAGEFESYLWQDNSTQRTYTVIGSDYEPGSHMFWVEVTDSNTCKASDTISVTIEEISGIVSSYRNEGMLLYPNPANDKINVEFTQPAGEKIIFEIISIEGQLLLSKTFRNIAKNSKEYIDLNGLSPGVYMVKINVGNHTKTQKLIIK